MNCKGVEGMVCMGCAHFRNPYWRKMHPTASYDTPRCDKIMEVCIDCKREKVGKEGGDERR